MGKNLDLIIIVIGTYVLTHQEYKLLLDPLIGKENNTSSTMEKIRLKCFNGWLLKNILSFIRMIWGYAITKYWFIKLSYKPSLSFSFSNFVLSSITLKFVKKAWRVKKFKSRINTIKDIRWQLLCHHLSLSFSFSNFVLSNVKVGKKKAWRSKNSSQLDIHVINHVRWQLFVTRCPCRFPSQIMCFWH